MGLFQVNLILVYIDQFCLPKNQAILGILNASLMVFIYLKDRHLGLDSVR